MSEPWIIEECRHQVALALAADVWRQQGRMPAPLAPVTGAVLESLRRHAKGGADGAVSADTIRELVRVAFAARQAEPGGLPVEPWSCAHVVDWWLQAAEVVEAWDAEPARETSRLLACGGGRQHPVEWCRERRRRLRFGVQEFRQHLRSKGQAWQASATSLDDALTRLFRWVTSCDRDGMPAAKAGAGMLEWIRDIGVMFADIEHDHARLFGDAHASPVADPLSWDTRHEWIPRWVTTRLGDQLTHEFRRPIVGGQGGTRKTLFKGLAVVTLPVAIVAELTALPSPPSDDGLGSVHRAAIAAKIMWRDVKQLLSRAFADASAAVPQAASIDSVSRFFLPAARCLVAGLECRFRRLTGTTGNTGTATKTSSGEMLALALALDGFDLRPGTVADSGWQRTIPSRHAPPPPEPAAFTFVHAASATQMSVGEFGEPARCNEELLVAIEAVDWRLWAYDRGLRVHGDSVTAKIVEIVMNAAKVSDWEQVKRATLRGPDAAGLAQLFDHAHTRRLATSSLQETSLTSRITVPMLEELVSEYATLARTALDHLAAVDPQALARLSPPRRRDGVVDVAAWLSAQREGRASASGWRVAWIPNEKAVGTALAERRHGSDHVVEVSAGAIAAGDLALLVAPSLAATATPGSLPETLTVFQVAVAQALIDKPTCDVGPAVTALRDVFAGDRAAAFHALIERWRAGDGPATAWVQTLAADPRFRFDSHPGVDLESRAVAPAAAGDTYLDWAFDDQIPAGEDVAITFALAANRARRVISRGPRVVGSAADLVEAVVEAAGTTGPLADLAMAARRALDLWTRSPAASAHPATAAARLLDAVLDDGSAPADVRHAVFVATCRWCSALDHEVVPRTWRPDLPLGADEVGAQDLASEFHPTVPRGSVIVGGFGLTGMYGRPFSGAVSAGPAPAGVGGLRDLVRDLAVVGPGWAAVEQRVDDLAKHALANTQRLAASNLYDAFWEAAALDAPADHQARIDAAKTALFEFVKAVGGMVPFEPAAVGDYPTGWIRESDGKQPRGRRIRRIVRPGLRTMDNALVRPALVITE